MLILGFTTIILPMLLGIGLSLIASLLLRPKTPTENVPIDQTPTPLSKRGSAAPFIIGRRRATPVFCMVANRHTKKVKGHTGKGGGQDATKYVLYFEDGWQVVNMGLPGQGLLKIVDGQRTVWEGSLLPTTTPNGTKITTKSDGNFKIAWGSYLGASLELLRANVAPSNWPHVMGILWDPKIRKDTAQWPMYRYTIECGWDTPPLGQGTVFTTGTRGVNAGQAVYGLLITEAPIGAGIDPRFIDINSFIAMASCEQPVNGLWPGGTTVGKIIDDILSDSGFQLITDQGILKVVPLSPMATVTLIPESTFIGKIPERNRSALNSRSHPLSFQFSDSAYNFEPNTIYVPQDGVFLDAGTAPTQSFNFPTITSAHLAAIVAYRLAPSQQHNMSTLSVKLSRAGVRLTVGKLISLANYGRYRIQSRVRDMADGVSLQLIEDISNLGGLDSSIVDSTTLVELAGAVNDIRIAVAQIPNTETVVVFRIRGNPLISTAMCRVSVNGGSVYLDGGSQDTPSAGGNLQSAWSRLAVWQTAVAYALNDVRRSTAATNLVYHCTTAGTSGTTEPIWPTTAGTTIVDGTTTWTTELEENGPIFEPLNTDIAWDDLTGDDASVLAGHQVALVGPANNYEAIYFRNIVNVPETAWAANAILSLSDFVISLGTSTGFRYQAASAGAAWQGATVYITNTLASPGTANGFLYRCTTAGTSGTTEPIWPTTAGTTIVDGTATWTAETAYATGIIEPIWPTVVGSTVLDNHIIWTTHYLNQQLLGVVRGQQGTAQVDHAAAQQLFAIWAASLTPVSVVGMTAGVTCLLRTLCYTASDASDFSTAITYTIALT